MNTSTNLTEPTELNEGQILFLTKIYLKRRNLWGAAFSGSIFLFLISNSNIFNRVIAVRDKVSVQEQTHRFQIVVVALLCFLILLFLIVYFLKVYPLRQDIRKKSGIIHHLPVERKSSFPLVGTYFLFFNSDLIPNKEVNESEFNQYQEGDAYPVLMSRHARIVIDEFENYELI